MIALKANEIASRLSLTFPDAVTGSNREEVMLKSEALYDVAGYLKNAPELDFDYLSRISAVDYYEYFELVYHLMSIKRNHSLVLKTRCYDRQQPAVTSVVGLWQGADFQEREIYDLMGIRFQGHPNLKRILLWEGFQGHPLRKDYL